MSSIFCIRQRGRRWRKSSSQTADDIRNQRIAEAENVNPLGRSQTVASESRLLESQGTSQPSIPQGEQRLAGLRGADDVTPPPKGTTFPEGVAKKNVMTSVKGNSSIKDQKLALRQKKYPIREVNKLLDDNFDVSRYSSLQGKDNIYIVAPSTSGKNTIPFQMAKRLQAQYGGEVFDEAVLGIGKTEAKGKNFLEKALSKSEFELGLDESVLRGKNVVLVDDIFTSGGTVKGINDVFATKGIAVDDIAVLSAGDVRFASQKDLARITKKLSEKVGIDEIEAKSLVDNLDGISKTGANQIELNLNRNPQKIYDRLRETSGAARRTQRPPSGGAAVKGAGDTKGDNVGVGKMESGERKTISEGVESPKPPKPEIFLHSP